ncbi:hypothetical protein HPB52_014615 [Rhipicephalus sanguineus]|uniref:V-SNARE coiled-coil homology domain-containing protein n=1 Tax=Rhipicephalus sanguineus TaxID=34632 RepID=A0A9D4YQ31_RHISA|nr:hypothetical protein HPB52_014615 [Rhipicephalus sanguineus]
MWPVADFPTSYTCLCYSLSTCQYQGLEAYLAKYQVPTEADAMTKIQADLDETKIILHNTIEAVLERGEKLDDLVAKSEDLSMQSKTFYKTRSTIALTTLVGGSTLSIEAARGQKEMGW